MIAYDRFACCDFCEKGVRKRDERSSAHPRDYGVRHGVEMEGERIVGREEKGSS